MSLSAHKARPPHDKHKHTKAFTLIELSIVLVIIGLIVGGVLVGQDLIRAAELRSVISDIEKFKTAVAAFEGQYNCIPGDCPNAAALFGAATQCAGGPDVPLGSGTCNGNGNGEIELYNPSPAASAPAAQEFHDESFLFWNQLSLAGMVPGNFVGGDMPDALGALNSTASSSVPGVNVPASRIQNGCYTAAFSSSGFFLNFLSDPAANVFVLGNPLVNEFGTISGVSCSGGVMTANDAGSIDRKIDDGLPYSGTVQVPTRNFVYSTGVPTSVLCSTASPPYTYYSNSNGPDCAVIFLMGF